MLDEEGMMVWNENRNFGNFSQWLVDFVDFLRRDRNHPSVLLWSICNEGRVRYAMSGAEMFCGIRCPILMCHAMSGADISFAM